MRKTALLISLAFVLFLVSNVSALDVTLNTLSVKSPSPPFSRLENANPSPVVPQYDFDLALTNIGIEAKPNDCLEEGEYWQFWVKAHNAGHEIVDCAYIVFTLNGLEIGRVHVAALYPSEVRKYLVEFLVEWPPCAPFIIDAHVDWPPDENPANDDIEDEFTVAGEAVELLIRDSGILGNAWTWLPGYEYPDYALGSKWHFEVPGMINYWEMAYANVAGTPGGHAELFVFEADANGDIIDDGTGGIMNMEFQFPEIYWPEYAYICYPICLPIQPGDTYYFVWCNRQSLLNYWCIDDGEGNPDWNWQKEAGVWSSGSPYDGDWFCHIGLLSHPHLEMICENLTPVFCRGKNFYFQITIINDTGSPASGTLTFSGYSGYYCDPANLRVAVPSNKTYPQGETVEYYFFNVPNAAGPGAYSASVDGTLYSFMPHYVYCCMNTDIVQCGPWRDGDNTEWELVQTDRPEVALPTSTSLHQNYPNPFNAETNISYNLAEAGDVTLKVYDITGRLVETLIERYQETGEHIVTWDASNISSGVYFYKLTCGDYTATKKTDLLR